MNDENVKVSIITVCYNSEKTIRKTIESVKGQTYKNIEYIIVDGASTDNTLSIIKEYQDDFGERMKVISEPDNGIYNAMNKGISMASGALIGIINSDDYYEYDAVEKVVEAWDGNPLVIMYGLMRNLKNGMEDMVSMLSHEFLEERMIWHPSCFVGKEVYRIVGLYDEQYRSVADYDFMLKAYESKKVRFTPIYHIIANFETGGMSESVEGYLENLRFLRDKGKITNRTYQLARIYEPIKRKLIKMIWR